MHCTGLETGNPAIYRRHVLASLRAANGGQPQGMLIKPRMKHR